MTEPNASITIYHNPACGTSRNALALIRNAGVEPERPVELTKRNIPYEVRSGLRFFEQRHVKDVLAHLRFLANPRDEVAFTRMARLKPRLGQRLVARVWQALSEASEPLAALAAGFADELSAGLGSVAAEGQALRALAQKLPEVRAASLLSEMGPVLALPADWLGQAAGE